MLAIAAEQKAGKQMCFFLIGRAAHISPQHDLDGHEVFIGDKRFVGILYLHPLVFVLTLHHADFVVGRSAFTLCQYADIYFIGEDALDGLVCPLGGFSGLEYGIKPHTGRLLVLHRRKNAHLVETVCNPSNGDAVLVHRENHLHILADRFIHNQLILVLR